MRLDHLLSKEEVGVVLLLICQEQIEMPKESESSGGVAYATDGVVSRGR